MTISRMDIGKGRKRQERYFLMEGDTHIAWFDDLETAAKVNRFIKGAHLEKADYAAAKAALAEWDRLQSQPKGETDNGNDSKETESNTGPVDMQNKS